jgi:hypothetical protein
MRRTVQSARVETKTGFFHFREKPKSCENGVIFAKFREISLHENFRFRENFCQQIVKKSGQNMIIPKSKIFA